MPRLNTPETVKKLPLAIVKQMITLSTSGFGLVAALAWNEVIKSLIESYIKPFFGSGSGFTASLVYAVLVTGIAVSITLHLTTLHEKLEAKNGKTNEKSRNKKS